MIGLTTIIRYIKSKKKLTTKMLTHSKLNKALREKLEAYQRGSKRLDVNKLIHELEKRTTKKQKGGDFCSTPFHTCVPVGTGSYGKVYTIKSNENEYALKIFKPEVNGQNIITNLNNIKSKFADKTTLYDYTTFIEETGKDNCRYDEFSSLTNEDNCFRIKQELTTNNFVLLKRCKTEISDYKFTDVKSLHTQILRMLDALDFLTANNYVHCDIKPQNILIDIRDNWVLHDFDFSFQASLGADLYTYKAFTPSYISPYMFCTAMMDTINKNDFKPVPIKDHLTLFNAMHGFAIGNANIREKFVINALHTGDLNRQRQDKDNVFKFYDQLIHTFYFGDEDYTYGAYSRLIEMINKDKYLIHLNILKNDYYSFGITLYILMYTIAKELSYDPIYTRLYMKMIMEQLISHCIIPYYQDQITIRKEFKFKHGKHILENFVYSNKDELFETIKSFIPNVLRELVLYVIETELTNVRKSKQMKEQNNERKSKWQVVKNSISPTKSVFSDEEKASLIANIMRYFEGVFFQHECLRTFDQNKIQVSKTSLQQFVSLQLFPVNLQKPTLNIHDDIITNYAKHYTNLFEKEVFKKYMSYRTLYLGGSYKGHTGGGPKKLLFPSIELIPSPKKPDYTNPPLDETIVMDATINGSDTKRESIRNLFLNDPKVVQNVVTTPKPLQNPTAASNPKPIQNLLKVQQNSSLLPTNRP